MKNNKTNEIILGVDLLLGKSPSECKRLVGKIVKNKLKKQKRK